jgi:hypothetical protein
MLQSCALAGLLHLEVNGTPDQATTARQEVAKLLSRLGQPGVEVSLTGCGSVAQGVLAPVLRIHAWNIQVRCQSVTVMLR